MRPTTLFIQRLLFCIAAKLGILQILPAQCPLSITAGADTALCSPDLIQLNAGITGNYLNFAWSPVAGLSDAGSLSPTAPVTETTTYTLSATALNPQNLIVNGDFEAGNTGFTSGYTWSDCSLMMEGLYAILTQAYPCHIYWETCGDHTTGDGLMMLVNGISTPGTEVWCQTIAINPNTEYAFSCWAMSEELHNQAQLQFFINNELIGPVFTPTDTCVWQQFYALWNSGSAGNAEICILNQNLLPSGNDFALDDLFFGEICTVTDAVTVELLQPIHTEAFGTTCDPALAGVFTQTLASSEGCDSIVVQTVELLPSNFTEFSETTCDSTATGIFTQQLTNQYGCDSIVTTTITFEGFAVSVEITSPCAGGNNGVVTVMAEGGAEPFMFSLNNGAFGISNQFNLLPPGLYEITVQDATGCEQTTEASVEEALPLSLTIHPGNTSIVFGDSLLLRVEANFEIENLIWEGVSGGALSCMTCTTLVVSPQQSQTYTLTAYSTGGCLVQASLMVTVEQPGGVVVPNAFSPNGDGINDHFTIFGNPHTLLRIKQLQIFNRWGEMVFKGENFPPNDPRFGWDGSFLGKAMNPAVFVWWTEVEFAGGKTALLKGDVTLLR